MIRKTAVIALLWTLAIPAALSAAEKSIAVMNFANYGDKNIKFLSSAIPESISTALSENEDVRVVERRQLGRVIDEIALEQTGLVDTKGISRAGRLARADVIIVGSISGDKRNVIVTMKAVDVASGKVLDGKMAKGSASDIFDLSNQAARAMAAVISGKGIGRISISSNPSNADVFIDGLNVGKTPVVEYKLTTGRHRIKIVKDGYIDHEESASISANQLYSTSPVMDEAKFMNRTYMGIGLGYAIPFHGDIKNCMSGSFFIGQTYSKITLQLNVGYSQADHSYNMQDVSTTTEEERYYNLLSVQGQICLNFYGTSKYLLPYAGVTAGYGFLRDMRYREGAEDGFFKDNYEELQRKNIALLGAVAGITLLPFSKVSIFAEARYCMSPNRVTREVYGRDSVLDVDLKVLEQDRFFLQYVTLGGGIKYYF